MNRMSVKFIAYQVGLSEEKLYEMLEEKGIVTKNESNKWILTEYGLNSGGRMSKGKCSIPTFKLEDILAMIINFSKSKA